MIETKDIYWLAGILEGEGCFHTNGVDTVPVIALKMNDEDIVRRGSIVLGTSAVRSYHDRTRLGATQPYFIARLSGCRAAGWMMTLYPLLSKRRQAKIRDLLSAWRTHQGRKNGNPYNAPQTISRYSN